MEYFGFLFVGLCIGGAACLILKARLLAVTAQAKSESQIEIARLNERLIALQESAKLLQERSEAANTTIDQLKQQVGDFREKLGVAESTVANHVARITMLHDEKIKLADLRDQLLAEQQRLTTHIAELTTSYEAARSQNEEKLQLLSKAEEQLSHRFKTLANEILEDKSKRFTEQNQLNLNQLLEPLKLKITEFQGKVQEVYVQEGKDRSALAEQVKQLTALNYQLSTDAHNLTRALKGQTKAQGNWGELILERVLEASGLRKDHEYHVQESFMRADGSRAQPDVIIHLPEGRHLIVDAKVSLTAYEEHVNADAELVRDAALKRHLDSINGHIKGLAEKNYQQLYGLQSLDFVLMFLPVEPAFMLAISHDSNLWHAAWKKNVLLVSPSTLLFVVRTVAHLWRQEQQNRNAQDIAQRGAELYDKLVGFVGDLDNVGSHIERAQNAYKGAYKKLTTGRGNLIGQAQKLLDLGIKPTKNLSQDMIEAATDETLTLPS